MKRDLIILELPFTYVVVVITMLFSIVGEKTSGVVKTFGIMDAVYAVSIVIALVASGAAMQRMINRLEDE